MAVAAGIVGDSGYATVIAGIDVSAKPWRPARLYGSHDTKFATAEMACVVFSGIASACI